jgi:hypothetical protein
VPESRVVARFARLLHESKRRSGRTYAELGRLTLTSRSALHRYCTGQDVPSDPEIVARIAKVCGASAREVHDLLEAWLAANRLRLRPGLAAAAVTDDDRRPTHGNATAWSEAGG